MSEDKLLLVILGVALHFLTSHVSGAGHMIITTYKWLLTDRKKHSRRAPRSWALRV
jgi:hypothetical protein